MIITGRPRPRRLGARPLAPATARTLIVLLAIGLLAGCSAEVPGAVGPSSEREPTPKASVDPVVAPRPLLDLNCSDLASASQLESVSGDTMTLEPPSSDSGRYSMQLQQLGGLGCVWSNGQPRDPYSLDKSAERSAIINVVAGPDAAKLWKRYVTTYADASTPDYSYCTGFDSGPGGVYCSSDILVAGAWLSVRITGMAAATATTEAAATALARPIVAAASGAVAAAGPGGSPFTAPAGTPPLSRKCDDYLSPAMLAAALGTDGIGAVDYRDGPQIDPTIALDGTPLVKSCLWLRDQADSGPGSMQLWPAGEWAFRAATAGSPTLRPVTTGTNASVWIDCAPAAVSCTADIIVRHNWIRLQLGPDTVDASGAHYSYSADKETALRALAAEVLTKLAA